MHLKVLVSFMLLCLVPLAQAQKLGALVTTNAVQSTDTIPVTTDAGANTFKASVATIRGVWVDVTTNSYTLGNVGIGTLPITEQKMTLRVDNLTTLPINGLFLTNSTAATAGVTVQDSPYIYFSSGAWLTGSLSNAPVVVRIGVVPVTGAASPGSLFKIEPSLNGAPFANGITFDQAGSVSAPGNIIASAALQTGTSLRFGAAARLKSSADGSIQFLNSIETFSSTSQHNIPQVTWTVNHALTALESGLQIDNIGAGATNRLDLPVAVAKMRYLGYVDAAFRMQFQSQGSDIIRDGSTASGAAAGIWADAPGECIELFAPKAGVWVVRSKNGTWTIE